MSRGILVSYSLGTAMLPKKIAQKIKDFLEREESNIALEIEGYGELREVFVAFFGRFPHE